MPNDYIKNLYKASLVLLIVLSFYFAVRFLSELKFYGMTEISANVITLSGHGEVQAAPDIANISFSIHKEKKTVKEAQGEVAVIEKKTLDFLKENKVDEKDIKTTNASFYPKYEYKYDRVICEQYNCPPSNGKSVIVGYEASESIAVKIRNIDNVGKIMQGLGEFAVSDLSGPNFAIDKEDALKAEARKKAIDNAKEKAKVLAKDLSVSLGKITNFSESGNYPAPMYAYSALESSSMSAKSAPAVIPKGENTISSDVNITYEIK